MEHTAVEEVIRRYPPDRFHDLSMFGALSDPCVAFLLKEGEVLKIARGEQVMRRGDASDHFFVLLEGQLGYWRYADNQPVHVRSFYPGEQIGFVGMIGLIERQGDVFAEAETVALKIPKRLFHRVCDEYARDFVVFLINMTRDMSREITDLDALCAAHNLKRDKAS